MLNQVMHHVTSDGDKLLVSVLNLNTNKRVDEMSRRHQIWRKKCKNLSITKRGKLREICPKLCDDPAKKLLEKTRKIQRLRHPSQSPVARKRALLSHKIMNITPHGNARPTSPNQICTTRPTCVTVDSPQHALHRPGVPHPVEIPRPEAEKALRSR